MPTSRSCKRPTSSPPRSRSPSTRTARPAYELNKEAAVTVLVYKVGGKIAKNFAFKDSKSAADKANEIAATAADVLK